MITKTLFPQVGEQEGSTLAGVLVSVSGGEGYRSNILLQDVPLVLTGLVPGDYYIRFVSL